MRFLNKASIFSVNLSNRHWWWISGVLACFCVFAVGRCWALFQYDQQLPKVDVINGGISTSRSIYDVYPHDKYSLTSHTSNDLKDAELKAVVHGVVYLSERASVNISVGGEREKVYQVGDELASDVVIQRIEQMQVVVREHGVARKIGLFSPLSASDRSSIQLLVGTPDFLESDAKALNLISSESKPYFQTKLMVDASGIQGLKIETVDASLTDSMGFQRDDIVLALSETPIQDFMNAEVSLKEVSVNDEINLTILRAGKEITLPVNAKELTERINFFGH